MLRPHDTLAALPESLASVWKLDEDQGRAEDCWTAQTLCRDGITRQKRGAGIMSDSEAVDSTERRRSVRGRRVAPRGRFSRLRRWGIALRRRSAEAGVLHAREEACEFLG
jgi:hypothetical protein